MAQKAARTIYASDVVEAPASFSGFCPVAPVPKGRPRFNSVTKRTYTPAKTEKYEKATREWMKKEYGFPRMPMDGAIAAEYEFILPRPSTVPKKRYFSSTKPDIDNYEKSFQDALDFKSKLPDGTALGVIANDSRVASVSATKRYAAEGEEPGVRFSLRSCDTELLLVSDSADEDKLAVMSKGVRRMSFAELSAARKLDVNTVRTVYIMFGDEDVAGESAALKLVEDKVVNVEKVVLL